MRHGKTTNQALKKYGMNSKPPSMVRMKSSTRDEAEGKLHQVKGKIKEIAVKVILDADLEAEGKKENKTGKVQEKIGEIKKVVGK